VYSTKYVSTTYLSITKIQDIIWRVCLDIELEIPDAKAIKVFNEALQRLPIFEYAKIYYTRGRDELRRFIEHIIGLK